jgi:hypothetical protein
VNASFVKDGVDLNRESAATLASSLASTKAECLVGVTPLAVGALEKLGIVTIFDLANAQTFISAADIAAAVGDTNHPLSRADRVPDAWVVASLRGAPVSKIASSPGESLASVDGLLSHTELVQGLGVATVSDLGRWPPFSAARELAAVALGVPGKRGALDPGTPADLLPANGVYPTEVYYYDRLYLDEILGAAGARKDLSKSGQLSIVDAASKTTGFVSPALGAMITMEQSWHVRGLALGQLLHSVALAPGENVRIAMVNWSRRTAGTRGESEAQDEALTNQTRHNRAISEVTRAVAAETQYGGSMAVGSARTEQGGVGGGLGPVGGTYSQGSTNSFGQVWSTSGGSRNVAAQSSQDIAEATQQAAAATRSRRATVVQEVEESEASGATTRVVANYNHMHAMTVQYYETVQVFTVRTQVARVRRCLFVPVALTDFVDLPSGKDAAVAAGATDDAEMRRLLERAAGSISITYPKEPPSPPNTPDPGPTTWDETMVVAARDLAKRLRNTRAMPHEVALPQGALLTEIGAPSLKSGDLFIAETQNGERIVAKVEDGRAQFATALPLSTLRELKVSSSSKEPMGSIDITIDDGAGNRAILRNRSRKAASSIGAPLLAIEEPLTGAERDAAIARLQANRLFYNQAIWAAIDPATLALLLSEFDFEGRPVMEQIDPTPIAIAGNYLVFRMNTEPDDAYTRGPGASEPSSPGEKWHAWLVNHGLDIPHPESRLVALPCGGVFAEAVLGRSNSAELLDVTRFWNWQDSPTPLQPTEILPPSTESRRTPVDLNPGEFSNPMVNIVAPTALPDPVGMSGILRAITQGDMFRNMSGMDLAAGIARAAMEASTAAAGSAGTISAENYAEMNRHKEAIFDRFLQLYGKGAVGGAAPGNRNISTAGAALNYGRRMDQSSSGSSDGSVKGGGSRSVEPGLALSNNSATDSDNIHSDESHERAAFGSLIGSAGTTQTTPTPVGNESSNTNTPGFLTSIENAGVIPEDAGTGSLVGDPDGTLDLAQVVNDYTRSLQTCGAGPCVMVSLGYFTEAVRLKGADIKRRRARREDSSIMMIPMPDIANATGTLLSSLSILELWMSNTDAANWNRLPKQCRGGGAPGALLYADLVVGRDLLVSKVGWPQGMIPGALLQMWPSEEDYFAVRDGTTERMLGHSPVFHGYVDDDPSKIIVSDNIGVNRELAYGWLQLRYVIAANLGKARITKFA